mmetsp:Transcript_118094/g.252356  ORF Transcript_118094/g.252356 Transcript_118094/m.252356 type:complete len:275 (-) Transcript_118094:65-889(-)
MSCLTLAPASVFLTTSAPASVLLIAFVSPAALANSAASFQEAAASNCFMADISSFMRSAAKVLWNMESIAATGARCGSDGRDCGVGFGVADCLAGVRGLSSRFRGMSGRLRGLAGSGESSWSWLAAADRASASFRKALATAFSALASISAAATWESASFSMATATLLLAAERLASAFRSASSSSLLAVDTFFTASFTERAASSPTAKRAKPMVENSEGLSMEPVTWTCWIADLPTVGVGQSAGFLLHSGAVAAPDATSVNTMVNLSMGIVCKDW